MKLQHIALVCLLALSAGNVTAQMLHRPDSMYTFTDPRLQKKHPWRAAAETFGMNVGVWAFDRYVMNEDFAKISIGSIRRNIKHGFSCWAGSCTGVRNANARLFFPDPSDRPALRCGSSSRR